mgnify:CR=1 FL=1
MAEDVVDEDTAQILIEDEDDDEDDELEAPERESIQPPH